MCIAYPGIVKKIEGLKAVIDYDKESREVLIGDKKVKVGDKVLVQMGIIVKVLSESEAKEIKEAWNTI